MIKNIKFFLKWALVFAICFIVIYLFVLCGGWKLFESGDPILIEIGVAFILSFFVFGIIEAGNSLGKRVEALEKRLSGLEKSLDKCSGDSEKNH